LLLAQQWGTKMIIMFEAASRKNNIRRKYGAGSRPMAITIRSDDKMRGLEIKVGARLLIPARNRII
jgi:hypothetical protein